MDCFAALAMTKNKNTEETTMSQQAKRVVLISRPVGEPKESNFRIEDCAVPTPGPGEVLLLHHLAVARSLYARPHE